MFKYMLLLPDGSPTEPSAALVTAVPTRKVGEACAGGSGDGFRLLVIDTQVHEELVERG